MPRHGKPGEGPPDPPLPAAKRTSNPRALAKVVERPHASLVAAAELAGEARSRGRRRKDSSAELAALPAAVRMEAAQALDGGGADPRCGVVYRFTIRDLEGRPLVARAAVIRRHLLPSGGAPGAAQITTVTLDDKAGALAFVGTGGGEPCEPPLELREYFSFEVRGMTFVIPRSGYGLTVVRRGAHLWITRTPRAVDSIHGAAGEGLADERARDTYACRVG